MTTLADFEAILNSDLSHAEIADRLTDQLYRAHLQTWSTGELIEVARYAQHEIRHDPELRAHFPRWERTLAFHLGELMRRAREGQL